MKGQASGKRWVCALAQVPLFVASADFIRQAWDSAGVLLTPPKSKPLYTRRCAAVERPCRFIW